MVLQRVNFACRSLLLLLLVLDGNDGGSLLGKSLLSSVSHVSVAQTTSLHLVCKVLRASLLCLGLVDVLHQHTLVLENVTLALQVELVVPANKELIGLLVSRKWTKVWITASATVHQPDRASLDTHRCLSILPASRYFRKRRRRTRWRLIH